ncbi:MAG: Holliday junction resolvase RuvX [Pseudomonadota bacterium]
MTVCDALPDFAAKLHREAPLIGLDLGTKTIGVAASDPARRMAMPVETLKRSKFSKDAERLIEIVAERNARGFVLGLPLNMDGSEGPRAQSARAFARNLSERIDHPVLLWDERLSTVAAERTLLEADTSRTRRREVIDKMAAAFILQGALDGLQTHEKRGS